MVVGGIPRNMDGDFSQGAARCRVRKLKPCSIEQTEARGKPRVFSCPAGQPWAPMRYFQPALVVGHGADRRIGGFLLAIHGSQRRVKLTTLAVVLAGASGFVSPGSGSVPGTCTSIVHLAFSRVRQIRATTRPIAQGTKR